MRKTNPTDAVKKVKDAKGQPAQLQAVFDNMRAFGDELVEAHAAAANAAAKDAVLAEYKGHFETALAELETQFAKGK